VRNLQQAGEFEYFDYTTYKVQWRVLSVDGDVTEGVFTFSIE